MSNCSGDELKKRREPSEVRGSDSALLCLQLPLRALLVCVDAELERAAEANGDSCARRDAVAAIVTAVCMLTSMFRFVTIGSTTTEVQLQPQIVPDSAII